MSDKFPLIPPPSRADFSHGLPAATRKALADSFALEALLMSGQGVVFAENMLYLAWLWANGYVQQTDVFITTHRPPREIPIQSLDPRADFNSSYFPERNVGWIYYSHELDALEDTLRGVEITW